MSAFRALQWRVVEQGEQQPQSQPEVPEPAAPRLPQRATIYIAPDGTVHFGALFRDLVPVADALAPRRGCGEK